MRTELSRQGPKGYIKGMWDSHCDTHIRLGRAGGLETALRALRKGNIGIEVLQETKLTEGIHTRRILGYTVCATEADSRHQGGIAIFWREAEGWGVDRVRSFGPNVASFIIKLGRKCWYIVRSYMPPNDLPTVHWIMQVLECGPEGAGKLLVGNLNSCLENPRYQREEQLATVLAGHGLTDQAWHFLPRRK